MNKKEIVKALETIAIYLELKGENSFKISAYRKAARALEEDLRSMNQIEHVEDLPGIGKGTASVINELLETGQSSLLEELKKEVPTGLIPLLKLPGLGGKKLAKLYEQLNIIDAKSLQKACEENRIQHLPGFGKKSEEKILSVLKDFGKSPDRFPIAMVIPIVADIEQQLASIKEIDRFAVAGSYRRFSETVKDLDFVIATKKPEVAAEKLLKLKHVSDVIANGETKVSVELIYEYPIGVDFRLVEPHAYATALHHFTGSQNHNILMRQLAKKRGEKISEYGIETENGELITFESEEEFFNHFQLHDIPPELRIGEKETERFKEDVDLISIEDIKGDLHMHSTWSDGANTIEEMALAAMEKGYEYIAITDHSQFLKVANGLTPDQIKQQREEIKRLNSSFSNFAILTGVEMDILPDGTLDFDDALLEEIDFVIASIHSSFSQNRDKIMQRLIHALNNVHVDLIAHPTGRLIGRRSGYDVDLDMLIDVAKETKTALELNSNPNRLDLAPKWLEKAQNKGVKLVINTDAHHELMLEHMKYGIATARKGWVKSETVLNTYSIGELRKHLNLD
ncbi:DNA polymerase/3'-5' exonuclease PolX [Pueribacillus theae]|uniref:DNA polymerase/3'-5' exonuclease PolX n=1 Tax=Pueribacillus theae TaxID=2171751 RepID=A0A2U1K456_9BACI|nr:DNA polymerase/3'-5' exonuclease PolX [Pueribacillus theae]PWA12301.1 DNA polymerase/3'-5' exonuclease PolX [Pueribacillus theae]